MKHVQFLVLPVLFGTLLAACGTTIRSKDTEVRRRAANLPILTAEEVGDRPYEIIGEASGHASAHKGDEYYSPPSLEYAHQELRFDGAELGADALINTFCEEGRRGLFPRTDVIQCYADAIRWENQASVEH